MGKSIVSKYCLLHGIFHPEFFDDLKKQKIKQAYVMEGRPGLKNSQRIVKELLKRDIKPVVIADNMAGFLFYQNCVTKVFAGYHIENAKGVMLEVGGLILGVLAKKHNVSLEVYPGPEEFNFLGQSKDLLNFNEQKVVSGQHNAFVPLVEWVPRKYITKVCTKEE
ncbi:MAG: hypothetical protein KC684_07445 [Candidatus Omnitrophica bacterium]|nr:hypothetical protein [Candidatus Omnitrophota bacterium]